MPDLRVQIGDKHIQMLDSLTSHYGYEGKSRRAEMLAHLIAEAYARAEGNRWADLRGRAARVLSVLRNWPSPLRPQEIKAVAFKDGLISITTTLSGEPYQLRQTDWESIDE